jgi:HK97 family phage major capsid protein
MSQLMLQQLSKQYDQSMGRAEELRKKYNGVKGNLTPQEEQEWDGLLGEADGIKGQMERLEKQMALEKWGDEPQNGKLRHAGNETEGKGASGDAARRKSFEKFLKSGFRAMNEAEVKAMQADDPAGGGYLVAPQEFVSELLVAVKDMVYIRQLATTHQLERADSLGAPTLDTDLTDAEWVSELTTGSNDELAFGKRELKPHPSAKRVKISRTLIRRSGMDAEAIVRDRLAYKYAITEEKAFLTGNGVNRPLGVFTASADGISTGRDTAAAGSTAVVGDDFIDCKHDLKPQYWDKAVWMVHRDLVRRVRKLKDSTNNYIWSPGLGPGAGLTGGNPNTIVDCPYRVSEYAPNTFTTGQYVAVLGDFRFYWIADALDMEIQVLDQLYAETNQMGYISRLETDGMPVLEEAFRRLKLA